MIIPRILFIALLTVILEIPGTTVVFDFEDGSLQGWTLVQGDAGPQPVSSDDDRHGGNFGKQGKYFIGTYENLGDKAEVELRSPVFKIQANKITLLVGGGNYPDATFVGLYREEDNSQVFSETGYNTETMSQRIWDVTNLRGQRVYLKIVDRHTGDWRHINVDNIRELTPEEEALLESAQQQKQIEKEQWLASLEKSTPRKIYKGDELKDLAIPLGGIGAGNIAICGDGALREWQIFNKVNSACVVPGQFFAIRAKQENKKTVTRLLRTAPIEDLPLIKETQFVGEFPIAEVHYLDEELPVKVIMKAFSPFIPMNSKDSGIPGIFFVFQITNLTPKRVAVSLVSSLQNAVNYDGFGQIRGVEYEKYGGNINSIHRKSGFTIIHMSNPSLSPDERQYGTMALGAISEKSSVLSQWDTPAVLWDDFSRDGQLDCEGSKEPSPPGHTWNAAIAVPITLQPKQSKFVTFFISWHFPNYYAEYNANLANNRLGRAYATRFKDALEVGEYLAKNFTRLAQDTLLFHDTLFDTTLPYWFINKISSQVSTLTSQVCLWIEDDTFHAFEGAGCCPMNCTHVWNYEQTLSRLFPDIERRMRYTDLKIQQIPSGGIRHRTILPLSLPRATEPFVDGHLGTILKSYREYCLCADKKWLEEMWPNIKLAMDFVLKEWDRNCDGVLVNEQWNTYDAAMYGPNTFIGTLYLAALRAAEEMAKVMGDLDSAKQYRFIFALGRTRLDSLLWNGEYYIHIDGKNKAQQIANAAWLIEDWPEENNAPNVNRPYGSGCHADQLLGQWWANILDLGYLLPRERVLASLNSILKYNWRWDFVDVPQQRIFATAGDKGLLNCTWPKGGRPENAMLYSDEVWTGIEYEIASLLIFEGKIKEAYQVVKAIDDRYNGVPRPPFKRNPWNEIECGEHYARAMSSWAMLLAAQGNAYCGPDAALAFNPKISPDNHKSFFSGAEGWGTFSQKRTTKNQTNKLKIAYGNISITTLTLCLPQGVHPKSVLITVDNKTPECTAVYVGESVKLHFKKPLILKSQQTLLVEFNW